MNWTQEQENAIKDRGGSLLISAAAGSGKTAVLVERAVGLMLDEASPIPADRILIVTFTRATAEELRGRIGARLAAMQQKQPNNMYLRRQRLLLGRACICTVDAFCNQLLKLYFAELSLPPDFDKGDDALIEQLKNEAMAQTMEKMYEDDDFVRFAALYGKARGDSDATEAVLKMYGHLRSAALPKLQATKIVDMWASKCPVHETLWGKQLLKTGKNLTISTIDIAKKALQIISECGLSKFELAFSMDIEFLNVLLGFINSNRWDDACVSINEFKHGKNPTIQGKKSEDELLLISLRELVKDNVKKLKTGIFICTQAEHEEDVDTAYPLVKALVKATQMFEEDFYAKKLEAKALEYSDFEHLTRKLLCDDSGNKTQTASEVASQFDAIMVDEYQDTNNLQELLYTCLANDEQSNLFMVGDVKQSIYRFRLAEPSLFVNKKDSYFDYNTGKHPAMINFGHNFRSTENVIDQINYFFNHLMSRELGGVNYDNREHLVAGKKGGGNATLDIKIIDTNDEKSEAADATEIANEIATLVNDGFLVTDDATQRRCRYGDFCILLRTKASFVTYAAALEAKGIRVVGAGEGGELLSPEISPFLSLLRVIDNPVQDIYLAAVMMSPMYNFTADHITALRKKEHNRSLYSLLLTSDGEKEKQICDDLMYLRTINACADFTQLCDEIMSRTSYFAAVSAMDEGMIRRENLNSFINFAAASCGAGGLSGFLRRLEAHSGDMSSKLGFKPAIDAVSLMSVHKSKGLEFPVCILANTQHGFNFKDTYKNCLLHAQLGLGLNLRKGNNLYPTLSSRAIAIAEKAEIISEEMRMLYVALTRAKDKLIVTMSLKKPVEYLREIATAIVCGKSVEKDMLMSANNMATWICAMALSHPMCDELRQACGIKSIDLIKTNSRVNAQIIHSSDEIINDISQHIPLEPSDDLVNELKQGFEWAENAKKIKKVPVKMSVSQLSKDTKQVLLARPSFMLTQGLTAAESGTAMHNVLQFADFESATNNLDAELKRLQEQKFVKAEIMARLNKASFVEFLKSDVAKRISRANKVLREYDFLSEIIVDGDKILVQGIADVVIINDNGIEIVDYKTDKGKNQQLFVQTYAAQLKLYGQAVEKRLQKKVNKLTIYSLELQKEINVD